MLNTGKLAGKVIYISGASRGIGKAIALKAAKDGARVVVAAKTAEPHPTLSGTIYTAAEESSDEGTWHMDLKNVPGSSGAGEPKAATDVTFSLSDTDFHQLFEGKLNPTSAFMSGKLKMEGNLGKAMALEKVMKKMKTRGYHTLTNRQHPFIINNNNSLNDFAYHNVVFSRKYSDTPPATYTSVPQVFERIKAVANADMVEKVKACYVFQLDGEDGKYYIDLKEGEGQVGEGDVPNKPADFKPEVKITMSQENMLKMFNRELAPATAFMTGKLKLSGDLSKALALETVLKTAREAAEAKAGTRSYHTSAPQLKFDFYETIPEVRERMAEISSKRLCKDVKAIYFFDILDDEKFYVDWKNGSGGVGVGEPPMDKKPDVSFTLRKEWLIKVLNRDVTPASIFMSGKVKVMGDLSKALKLEEVLRATREADEKKAAKNA